MLRGHNRQFSPLFKANKDDIMPLNFHHNKRSLVMSTFIPSTGFLRLSQVLNIVPVSKSSWWEGCKTGRFPKPVKLGPRTTAWRAEDITALVQSIGGNNARPQA
jgi:predicted DNA-binding transcriptional regulator AlpA